MRIHGLKSFHDSKGTVDGSHDLIIQMIPSSTKELLSDAIQTEDATMIYEWMQRNLPSGTYQSLIKILLAR